MSSALATETSERRRNHPRRAPVRVMIVDDSITARAALSKAVESSGDAVVSVTASSAEVALQRLQDQTVDVILLDLEMPGMGGLQALPKLLEASGGAQVLVVSSLTTAGAEATLRALAMGAADTLAKPRTGGFDEAYIGGLLGKLRALARGSDPIIVPADPAPAKAERRVRPDLIALGASTGGIHALGRFFSALPSSVRTPILVTQHLPQSFMPVFARQVAAMAGRPAAIAQDGDAIAAGTITIAPGDAHLRVRLDGGALRSQLARHPVPSGCCPSVDPMFESMAAAVGEAGLGIVFSGMGRDGALGAVHLDRAGGTLMAQDEASSAVFGMPRGIVEAGIARAVEAPEVLARHVARLAGVRA